MATPTREEMGAAVEALEKKAGKFENAVKRWKNMHEGVKGHLSVTARVAPFTPVAGMAATYLTGYADAMLTSPEVKNPVTIGVGIVSWLTSAAAAFMGHPIIAVGAGAVATAELGALTHDVGFAKGSESKAAG